MTEQPPPDQDHADPAEVLARGELGNGLRVIVRPMRPDDRERVAEGFKLLSERSRYLRFLTGKGRLSEANLHVLVDEVDQHGHVALALLWPRHSQPDILIGVGRFVRFTHDPTVADVAVTIADELHGLGAGRLMITALAQRAREEGVVRFTATMASENEASFRMMAGVGPVSRDEQDNGVREISVELGS